ncbi:hypothetical protein MJG53_003736 [Ovis ammon polii x Ovis aries]|uniref:Uncharacterized protein n=1 Tax=Ovis ammon polii x Ovis aries TaxID=2918886 RepID=A0ACB9VI61_9CETA|nr:hypothetical protein MJG53_003736 [Ovis ammon polii x Ovis aries]
MRRSLSGQKPAILLPATVLQGMCKVGMAVRRTGRLLPSWSFSSENTAETTELGSKKELKSMPFITYLSGLLTAQMLSDDQLISGVEIRCEEKGRCPSTCHLCRRPGKEQLSPTPVLLEINRVVPLYTLIQDNGTKEVVLNHFASAQSTRDVTKCGRKTCVMGKSQIEAFRSALMSSYWCSGKGDVIDDWCRCDLSAFDASGLPNCSPLPQPVLRLSPTVEPSSTVVSLEWVDVQPAIGTKVSDYILQHKKVDEYTDTDLYTGKGEPWVAFEDDRKHDQCGTLERKKDVFAHFFNLFLVLVVPGLPYCTQALFSCGGQGLLVAVRGPLVRLHVVEHRLSSNTFIMRGKKLQFQRSLLKMWRGREFLSFADDLLSGLGTSCVAAGRSHGEVPEVSIYSVIFKCLEPDGLYKFTLYAVDTRGRHSELSTVTLRTACPLVDDNKAEEIADKIYNLYNGYTSGKEQQAAYNTLMEVSASMLFRVQHHYNSHYEKFGDFVWRSEDELGPRKAHLILRRLERVSSHCSSLLRSAYIQSRVDTVPYLFCRSEEVRPAGMVWYSILKDTKVTCEEKMVSMARNTYGESKGR